MDEVTSTMTTTEAPDSNSATSRSSPPSKPKPTSRFKGVVPQANGHWGAQIYANHHRIWLGTFKTEELAAAAYDSAAINLRHGNSADTQRNFPVNEYTVKEPEFQRQFSNDQVLNMIKDGSYETKYREFIIQLNGNGLYAIPNRNGNNKKDGYYFKELFRKELTPSDVGKLNRLVIPKRYANKYFNPQELVGQDFGVEHGDFDGDIELSFYDKTMRNWKFRYCYWKSSSSYVFTRGWNSFVKVKELKAKDIVAFYLCELRENVNGNDYVRKFYRIDVVGCATEEEGIEETSSGTKRDLEEVDDSDEENDDDVGVDVDLPSKRPKLMEVATNNKEHKGFKLFGVQILPVDCN